MDQQKLKREIFAEIDRCVSHKLKNIMAAQQQLQQQLNSLEQQVASGSYNKGSNSQLMKLDDDSMKRMTVMVRADVFTEINKTIVPTIKKIRSDLAKVELVAKEAMFDSDSALAEDRRKIHGSSNNDFFVLNE